MSYFMIIPGLIIWPNSYLFRRYACLHHVKKNIRKRSTRCVRKVIGHVRETLFLCSKWYEILQMSRLSIH